MPERPVGDQITAILALPLPTRPAFALFASLPHPTYQKPRAAQEERLLPSKGTKPKRIKVAARHKNSSSRDSKTFRSRLLLEKMAQSTVLITCPGTVSSAGWEMCSPFWMYLHDKVPGHVLMQNLHPACPSAHSGPYQHSAADGDETTGPRESRISAEIHP